MLRATGHARMVSPNFEPRAGRAQGFTGLASSSELLNQYISARRARLKLGRSPRSHCVASRQGARSASCRLITY